MSTALSTHAQLARRIGLPQVVKPPPPVADPEPSSPAGSLFDGSDDEEDAPKPVTENKSTPTHQPPPILSLKEAFPSPSPNFVFEPPRPTVTTPADHQVSAKQLKRAAEGVTVLNKHACKGQSKWTSMAAAPTVPQAVNANSTPLVRPRATPVPEIRDPVPSVGLAAVSNAPTAQVQPVPRPAATGQPAQPAPAANVPAGTTGQTRGPTPGEGRPPVPPTNNPAPRDDRDWNPPRRLPDHMMIRGPNEIQVATHTQAHRAQQPAARPVPAAATAPARVGTAPARGPHPLSRTYTAPPTTRPAAIPAPMPAGGTGGPAVAQVPHPAAPPQAVRRTLSIPNRPPTAPPTMYRRRRAPGPSTTAMHTVPLQLPAFQPLPGTLSSEELAAMNFEQEATDLAISMGILPMPYTPSTHTSTSTNLAPLPMVSGTMPLPPAPQPTLTVPSQMPNNSGAPRGAPVGTMYIPGPPVPTHIQHTGNGFYAFYPPPTEFPARPSGSQAPPGTVGPASDGSFSVAAWIQGGSTVNQPPPLHRAHSFHGVPTGMAGGYNYPGAFIPPPPLVTPAPNNKRRAEELEDSDDEVQEIPPPSQRAKRSKESNE